MKQKYFEVAVLGLGAMGSATLYALSKRGLRACGIEQFGIAHDRGSSHGETRMIRKAYFEHPDYMPLLEKSYELWHKLEDSAGESLLTECDLIVSGPPDSESILGLDLCYSKYDLPNQKLTIAEAAELFPQFKLPENHIVYLDPAAGFLHVERCVQVQIELAQQSGSKVFTAERVLGCKFFKDEIEIETENQKIRCAKLVVTAGAWTNEILPKLPLPLQVWRKPVCWYRPNTFERYQPENFPMFYVEIPEGAFYGIPAINEKGVKIGEHTKPDPVTSADAMIRSLNRDDEECLQVFVDKILPDLATPYTAYSVCMYTKTPDGHFILDQHPQYGHLFFAAGFSGHGFKFAPVIGEIMADLTLQGSTDFPIDFLRLNRFEK